MQEALTLLKNDGRVDDGSSRIAGFNERQRLVQKPLFDDLEDKYSTDRVPQESET
jgi:hypothetical protein